MPSLVEHPKGVNDCSMTLCLHLYGSCCVTVVSVYAPALDIDDVVIAQFHMSLRGVLNSGLLDDKIILLRDFKPKIGTDWLSW